MIVSELNHIESQAGMTSVFRKAVEFLKRPDLLKLADGRVEIDGNRMFAILQRYETLSVEIPRFEYHRRYIDIQFIASGEEMIGWIPVNRIYVTDQYDPDKDIAFGTARHGEWTSIRLSAGQLAVFFPEDGHAPRLAAGSPSAVFKVVVKIAVDEQHVF